MYQCHEPIAINQFHPFKCPTLCKHANFCRKESTNHSKKHENDFMGFSNESPAKCPASFNPSETNNRTWKSPVENHAGGGPGYPAENGRKSSPVKISKYTGSFTLQRYSNIVENSLVNGDFHRVSFSLIIRDQRVWHICIYINRTSQLRRN